MLSRFRLARTLVAAALAATAPAAVLAAPAAAERQLTIRGAGFGHGVGMSQYGAQGYALQGKRHRWILAHYFTGTKVGRAPARTVRVRLASGRVATFAGATRAGRRTLDPTTTYTARLIGGKIQISGGGHSVRVAQRARIAGRGPLQVGGLGSYRGALELSDGGDGLLQVVNAVGVEEYVRGVVAQEAFASWRAEALKAQAVASRTYALANGKGGDGWDHYADTRSQRYGGVAAETPTTDAAVAATRGQVVTYRRRIVPIYFHASSGGRTENVEVGLGATPQPWLRGVADPFDRVQNTSWSSWTRTFPIATAEQRLGGMLQGSLIEIRVLTHGFSGRVVSAEVVGSGGTTTVTGNDLAGAFALPSTWAAYAVGG
ncbi:SpoIID/LytB domain-containing protein [Conexibacter stalactiti]|uniref:SpoIID/LytB domain-containing protein n=1 Tax=Conexibacter stalactiti TaxID=1940611 RepID=A0ABU4HZ09_9ACTN|nr:SpoIID/LytB domain-containing protein [Conexibacter stalactiti]MDW5598562.1 SpoIID/LytB domain-containing protein [Conexibacter stalactiti]MEC5039204.1 SpoIID/LytB domain-containing protein [Conexibacter stalactiti]